MSARTQPRFRPRGRPRRSRLHPPLRLRPQSRPALPLRGHDGVFAPAPAGGVVFHAAAGLDENALTQVPAQVCRRWARASACGAACCRTRPHGRWRMGTWGRVSVDASVRIEAADRAGCLRLLRYCARPPFASDRSRELDPERLLYESTKPGPGGNRPLLLTPLELLDRIAALVPSPRIHRHRYFGVLAPHSPLRAAVTALAPAAATTLPAPAPNPESRRRTGSSSCRPLRLGAVARPHLRSIPALVSDVRGRDAHHRLQQ
jgi:Putative transposase